MPVSFGLPIIEKASVEDDTTLQEKWANMLANARDATYDKPLRRNYTSILADLEPIDVKILDVVVPESLGWTEEQKKKGMWFSREKLAAHQKIDPGTCENAIRNLMRLGLLKPGNVQGGVSIGSHPVSSYKDTEMFGVTQMGVDFYHAVNDKK